MTPDACFYKTEKRRAMSQVASLEKVVFGKLLYPWPCPANWGGSVDDSLVCCFAVSNLRKPSSASESDIVALPLPCTCWTRASLKSISLWQEFGRNIHWFQEERAPWRKTLLAPPRHPSPSNRPSTDGVPRQPRLVESFYKVTLQSQRALTKRPGASP